MAGQKEKRHAAGQGPTASESLGLKHWSGRKQKGHAAMAPAAAPAAGAPKVSHKPSAGTNKGLGVGGKAPPLPSTLPVNNDGLASPPLPALLLPNFKGGVGGAWREGSKAAVMTVLVAAAAVLAL